MLHLLFGHRQLFLALLESKISSRSSYDVIRESMKTSFFLTYEAFSPICVLRLLINVDSNDICSIMRMMMNLFLDFCLCTRSVIYENLTSDLRG